jgi:hypothetical protein
MQVGPNDVSVMFDAVVSGRLERENAEAWAQRRVDALDAGSLVFVPAGDERRLLSAIELLLQVTERDEAGDYVYSNAALANFRLQNRL